MTEQATNQKSEPRPELRMQKMYIKDLSFENPNAPQVYMEQQQFEPQVELNLNLNHRKIDNEHFEVSLQIYAKVAAKDQEKVMFILEIEHAAVFLLRNIPEEHIERILGVDCPTLLFPFTRQIVSQVTVDGGFAPFLMDPVNFMGVFENSKAQKKEANN